MFQIFQLILNPQPSRYLSYLLSPLNISVRICLEHPEAKKIINFEPAQIYR